MASGENGDDLLIYADGTSIGGQRNVSMNAEMTVIDTSAKGDVESTFIAGRTTHSIDLDGLYINGNTAWDQLSSAMENQASITLERYRNGSFVASATAYVTSLSRSHPDMDVATVSVSLQISGTWSTGL
jgi:hypothetical protein